jgi:hypothetical protein
MKLILIIFAAGLLASCDSGTVAGSSRHSAEESKRTKDPSVIVLDAAQQQNGHVTVAQARTTNVASTLSVPGHLTVSEDRTWHIGAIAGAGSRRSQRAWAIPSLPARSYAAFTAMKCTRPALVIRKPLPSCSGPSRSNYWRGSAVIVRSGY